MNAFGVFPFFHFCHVERSRDISDLKDELKRFDLLTPVRSAFGPPVHVAASPAAPFSTPLGMTM